MENRELKISMNQASDQNPKKVFTEEFKTTARESNGEELLNLSEVLIEMQNLNDSAVLDLNESVRNGQRQNSIQEDDRSKKLRSYLKITALIFFCCFFCLMMILALKYIISKR